MGHCWLPLAAELTPANVADGPTAEQMLPMVTAEAKYVLGDSHYQTAGVAKLCEQAGQILVTSRGKRKRRANDPGREVRRELRKLLGRAAEPSAAIMASQSVKTVAYSAEESGYAGAKKIKGCKRLSLVDTLGLLIIVLVTAANVAERVAGEQLLEQAHDYGQ